ncbi:hypothetical protein J7337_006211 [Fusarium musae]|uniref:Uncharacterized protein n=1 Tax=Fusarium musae TaxID=1042133 RepID=A0A9P8DK54_9HYPO|nr:hypothetical protein J7337_006211 [Fusarium musae]KAG9503366.1 hypothetical protein J7337_006211 [Fusarium musae]
MPVRKSLEPDQGYYITNHDLITAIELVLGQANSEDCRKLRTMAAAIKKNFSSRSPSSLVKMAVFDCALIDLISRTDPACLGHLVHPVWLARELARLNKLERAIRKGLPLNTEEAAFLTALTGLNSALYEEWLENVIIEADYLYCILPISETISVKGQRVCEQSSGVKAG